jgi:hypothetical protein
MRKTLIHALIACALGAALGLLSDGARTVTIGEETLRKAQVCMQAGGDSVICLLRHAPERTALEFATEVLQNCEDNRNDPHFGVGKVPGYRANNEKWCTMFRAYIKQRWGY